MNNNKYLILAVVLIIIGIIYWGLQQSSPEMMAESSLSVDVVTYYYGETCPHCQEVNKFLEDNNIAEKVKFAKKDVWNDTANNAEMRQRVKECGMDQSAVGVPFLYARGKCMVGTPDVTGFFKTEAGLK